MNLNAYTLLVIIAMILAILGIVKPQWPLVAVSVLLVCVALILNGKT